MEVNQKPLTLSDSGVPFMSNEYCNVVAVTAEKKVATVERLSKLFAPCFCAKRMVGTPAMYVRQLLRGIEEVKRTDQSQ